MRKLLLFFAVATMLMACGSKHGPTEAERRAIDSAALKVAVMPTLDCLPLYVAETTGLFDDEGLSTQLVSFRAQMDCDTAIVRGRVECMVTDLVRAEWLQRQGMPLRYLTQTMLSWQLVSNRTARIRQLRQLDDKMLAMTRYSATALLADMAVDSARLKPERVFRIQVNDVGVRLSMLENNIIDALLLPEPQATQARNLRSHVLLDSRVEGLNLGVRAANKTVLKDTARQHQTDQLLRAYNKACDSINQHGLLYYRQLIEARCGVKASTVDSLPSDLHFIHAAPPRQRDIDRAKAWLGKQ